MVRRVESSGVRSGAVASSSTANTDALRGQLRVGQVVPAQVVRSLGPGYYLIALAGRQFQAESRLDLERKRLYVQVAGLWPKVHLRLIPLQQELPEWIAFAESAGIELTPFMQYVLPRLYSGRKPERDLKRLEQLRKLADRRTDYDLLSFERLLGLLDTVPDLPELCLSAFAEWTEAPPTALTDEEDLPETVRRFLIGPEIVLLPDSDLSPALQRLNQALIPTGITYRLGAWQGRRLLLETEAVPELGRRFRVNLPSELYGMIGITVLQDGKNLSISCDFEHTIARGVFEEFLPILPQALESRGVAVRNIHYCVRTLPAYLIPDDLVDLAV